jgi:hypothetical protein
MVGRWRPGPGARWDKREEFGRLIALGVSNAEACRIVGINRKTGSGGDTVGQSPEQRAGSSNIRRWSPRRSE